MVGREVEWFGWMLCVTLVGIPLGLALVLNAQCAQLAIRTEKNTREARDLLRQMTDTPPSSASR